MSFNFESHYCDTEDKWFEKYIKVCSKAYEDDLRLKGKLSKKDDYDFKKYSEVIILKDKNKCIGGARIVTHFANAKLLLPLESEDFMLKNILKHKINNLESKTYSEICRLSIDPKYRKTNALYKLMQECINIFIQTKSDYGICFTYYAVSRACRPVFKKNNLILEVHKNIPAPKRVAYGDLKLFLNTADLSHLYKR